MKINFYRAGNLLPSLLFCLSICLLMNLFQARPLYAQDAGITDFTVSNSESQLLLYFTVTDCFTADMEAAIHNGIPATFTFYVDIYRQRSNWPDKKIKKYEFEHIMAYDSLKKEYKIHLNEKGTSKLTASLDEAKTLMSEINGFKILPIDEVNPLKLRLAQ